MQEDDERGDSGIGLGRTLALSDGVFAIAMTLLAFQIQPPVLSQSQVHTLAHRLAGMGDLYFVYILSFAVIGLFWLAHHRLFRNMERADEPLMILNLLFLLVVAAMPFPSALLGRYGSEAVSVVVYATAMATAGILLTALTVVARARHLLLPGTHPASIRVALWRSGSMAAIFTLSIPLALASPSLAAYSWILTLPARFVGFQPRRLTRKSSTSRR